MTKTDESVSTLIDKTVDSMASSQAFHGYLNKTPPRNVVPSKIPQENVQLYLQRLTYYWQPYRLQQSEEQASIVLFLKGFF